MGAARGYQRRRRFPARPTRSPGGPTRGATSRSAGPPRRSAGRAQRGPPPREAEGRTPNDPGPRGDARPQAGFKAGHLLGSTSPQRGRRRAPNKGAEEGAIGWGAGLLGRQREGQMPETIEGRALRLSLLLLYRGQPDRVRSGYKLPSAPAGEVHLIGRFRRGKLLPLRGVFLTLSFHKV